MTTNDTCPKCGGTGVILGIKTHPLYGSRQIQEALPCECRLRSTLRAWFEPLSNQVSSEWVKQVKGQVNTATVARIFPKKHHILIGNLRGCYLYALEAMKLSLTQSRGRVFPYRVSSDFEFDLHYWGKESPLDGVDWRAYKLYIVQIGNMPRGYFSTHFASMLSFLSNIGAKVWLLYHHYQPITKLSDNSCWSSAMDAATLGWSRTELPAPFSRDKTHSGGGLTTSLHDPSSPGFDYDPEDFIPSAGNG